MKICNSRKIFESAAFANYQKEDDHLWISFLTFIASAEQVSFGSFVLFL